jgi:anti-sigma regulatory factor (Ser/Thr protein kinase)
LFFLDFLAEIVPLSRIVAKSGTLSFPVSPWANLAIPLSASFFRLAAAVSPVIACLDVGGLVERLAREYRHRAADCGLVLRCASRALRASTDAALLERMLRNLIENALRYTERGGVLVGVRQRSHRVSIEVVDTGIGVPDDKQAEIFEEFRQLGNPARDSSRGLGIGLSIVSRLAKLLGAEVQVTSKVGRGARFSLLLPLAQSEPIEPANKPGFEDVGGRILVIETISACAKHTKSCWRIGDTKRLAPSTARKRLSARQPRTGGSTPLSQTIGLATV